MHQDKDKANVIFSEFQAGFNSLCDLGLSFCRFGLVPERFSLKTLFGQIFEHRHVSFFHYCIAFIVAIWRSHPFHGFNHSHVLAATS